MHIIRRFGSKNKSHNERWKKIRHGKKKKKENYCRWNND